MTRTLEAVSHRRWWPVRSAEPAAVPPARAVATDDPATTDAIAPGGSALDANAPDAGVPASAAPDGAGWRAVWAWGLRRAGRRRVRPLLIGEVLVVLILVRVYDIVRSFAAARERQALDHGRDVLSLESRLHLNVELSVNHWLTGSRLLTDLAAGWYQFVHLTFTLVVLACCYYWCPEIYRRARNSLVLVNVAGLAVFWLYPVAPPRLLPGTGFIDADALAGLGQGPAGPVSPDLFGAMPSLHLAWATWTVIVLRYLLRDHPWPRRLVPAYACVTAFVVVSTANHYLLDVVAGVAVCLIASTLTRLIGPSDHTVPAPAPVVDRDVVPSRPLVVDRDAVPARVLVVDQHVAGEHDVVGDAV